MSLDKEERFLGLLERHKGILYKVASVYCGFRDDRVDLIQEITIQLWRSFDRFDGRCAFSTWMHRVAINVAISFHRGRLRRNRDTLPIDELKDEVHAADRHLDSLGDDIRRLYQLIGELDDMSKAVILLYLEGHGQDEIAEMTGITTSNVSTRIHRIKQRLQRDFEAREETKGKNR